MLEAAVYGALQDLDAMILFTYDIRPGRRQLEFFDVRSDPARWGLTGMCASIFLRRQVAPARRKVAIGYSLVDTHYPTHQPYPTDIYKLGWVSQVSNLFFDQKCEKGPDLLVASGRTSGSAYPGDRTVICANWPTMDLLDHETDKSVDQLSGYDIATVPEKTQEFSFGGTMYDAGQKVTLIASPGYLLADVQHNEALRPIGVGADGEACLGFRDMKRNNYVFRKLSARHELRVALDAVSQLYGDQVSHQFVDDNRYVSDTGQVKRLVDGELLLVDAPQVQALAGALQGPARTATSALSLSSASPIGVVIWLSLDGRPADRSEHWCLKMVTVATNTAEVKGLHHSSRETTTYALTDLGKPPVTTSGTPSDKPTTISLAGRELLRVFMENGTWELLGEGRQYYLWCDTPGVNVAFPGLAQAVSLTRFTDKGGEEPQTVAQPIVYPAEARMVAVRNP